MEQSKEIERLFTLDSFMRTLLSADHYVAKSEFLDELSNYADIIQYFDVLKDSGTLDGYCQKNGAITEEVIDIIECYKDYEHIIESQNERYIQTEMESEKDYLDNILKACDPNIVLDEDQRRVVLTDEDFCLVVAGAGAGKTTTIAAKVKYLVDKKAIDPKQILVISFTNKAVNELKQRIAGELHIECPIATFHSTGNAIIHKQNPEKLNIVDACSTNLEFLLIMLLLSTGMRISELCALTYGDIERDDRQIYVRPGKGRSDRHVPLDDFVLEALIAYCKETIELCRAAGEPTPTKDSPIFRFNDGIRPANTNFLARVFKSIATRAFNGSHHFTPHSGKPPPTRQWRIQTSIMYEYFMHSSLASL